MPKSLPVLKRGRFGKGFTLVELMVAIAVLALILVCVLSAINQASSIWRSASDKIEAFQDARAAFDLLTRNLSQATLNTYLDYDNADLPTTYLRRSDLQFTCGPTGSGVFPGTVNTGQAVFFQAPVGRTKNSSAYGGMESLLNGCGYYVEFKSDETEVPSFLSTLLTGRSPIYRFRLMQMIIPSEDNKVFSKSTNPVWFANHASDTSPVAGNIIALIIRPQDPAMLAAELPGVTPPDLTANYQYDSAASFSKTQPITSNQLPPVVQVTMVAITENAAKRLENGDIIPAAINSALEGRFTDPSRYAADLEALQNALNNAVPRIEYRVFSSAVPIRESRWSK